jgi:uncharacterized phage-associated protein
MPGDFVYDSNSIANYLIEKAIPHGGLDALQVLKLVYIAHGFVLGIKGIPLLEDDIEAWKYGPVVRSIYAALPGGSTSIMAPVGNVSAAQLDATEKGIVDTVYNLYGKHSGLFLSNLTHRPGSPWHKVWTTYGRNAVIPRDLIERHYERILDEWEAATTAKRPYAVQAL